MWLVVVLLRGQKTSLWPILGPELNSRPKSNTWPSYALCFSIYLCIIYCYILTPASPSFSCCFIMVPKCAMWPKSAICPWVAVWTTQKSIGGESLFSSQRRELCGSHVSFLSEGGWFHIVFLQSQSVFHFLGGQLLSDRRIRAPDSYSWLLQWEPTGDQKHCFLLDQLCWRYADRIHQSHMETVLHFICSSKTKKNA